ncbi:endonuclease [Bacillus sp. JJ1609]|uniref:endonuclease I family protein n=1 Tax=Bacillus sp. JJ1609 TaxID=3122977 RepID=UPI002FFECBAD
MISIQEEWVLSKEDHLDSIKNKPYYDCFLDTSRSKEYYSLIDFEAIHLEEMLHMHLAATHTVLLKYSPHQYVYPWVDLQEDGQLKSLYSGQQLDPLKMIEDDLRQYKLLQEGRFSGTEGLIYNCEHVVPQSWFDGDEPMRGDLHHLFACEPSCNRMRSNFPFYDFESYAPEFTANVIRTGCGMAENQKFEPEYGKGVVARAVFYFSLRYKGVISLKDRMDSRLLLKWHEAQPVTRYEKHRNAAIQELQGNRNPFIDFPEEAEKMLGM